MRTHNYFILKNIEKTSLLCLRTWQYDRHSLAQTSPVLNIHVFYGSKGVRAIEVLPY